MASSLMIVDQSYRLAMKPTTSCKLDDSNYLVWSLSFTIYVTTKDHLKHLNDAPPEDPTGDEAKAMALDT